MWSHALARCFALSSAPKPASKRLKLDTDLEYHYLEWDESKSDHTLVLVHGFLDFSGGWRATVAQGLGEQFHILAPDMRGHGDSDRVGPGGYYHFFDYVADLRSFIQSLGREKVSLVGHSMGGSIAGYYAGSFPDELAKLVLMEGMGPPENQTPAPDRVKQWVRGWKRAAARAPHRYASVEEAADKLRSRDPLLTAELALDLATWGTRELETGERVFKHDPLHLSMGPHGYSVDTAKTFWERITCPVLLVEGSDSRLVHGPEESERRHGALRAPQHALIEGAGHMMQRHKPAEVSQILLDFLS
jgi:pimeloyl-ACP methyl ester carboxylesterase